MTKKQKPIRIRVANNVDLTKMFSANLLGGPRGYKDAVALETFSNIYTPTIRCISNFVLVVEIIEDERENNKSTKREDGQVMAL